MTLAKWHIDPGDLAVCWSIDPGDSHCVWYLERESERPTRAAHRLVEHWRPMARKTSRDKRLKFFGLGNRHCPICLVQFTEENVRAGRGVTLEHAPPKTLGGREVCLTCEPCNSRASSTSDQAIKRSKNPPELQFDIGGNRRSARLWPDGIPPSRMPFGFGDSPAAKRVQRELAEQTIVAVSGSIQFDQPTTLQEVSVSLKSADPRHVEVSYVRSAYLLVFSLLGRSGYEYAQSDAVRRIRAKILNPNDEAGPSLVRAFSFERPERNIITVRNNARPFFWSVRFDDGVCVFLPHGGSESQYRQIAELPDEQSICGWEWEPQKFANAYVDRRRLWRQSQMGEDGLFGKEYVTVSNSGWEQRWVVVNEVGDAMRAGPETRPSTRP